jgi:hypothetical protein
VPLSFSYLFTHVAQIESLDSPSVTKPTSSQPNVLKWVLAVVYGIQKSNIPPSGLQRLNLYPRRLIKSKRLIASLTSTVDISPEPEIIQYHTMIVSTILDMVMHLHILSIEHTFTSIDVVTVFMGLLIFNELCGTGGGSSPQPLQERHMMQLMVNDVLLSYSGYSFKVRYGNHSTL